MKRVKHFFLLIFMMVQSLSFKANDHVQMKSYSNEIIEISEIYGTTTHSLILTFDRDPIINYAPASYQESQNNEINRYFMPNTTISSAIQSLIPSIMKQHSSGVELLLLGKLINKTIAGHKVMIRTKIS